METRTLAEIAFEDGIVWCAASTEGIYHVAPAVYFKSEELGLIPLLPHAVCLFLGLAAVSSGSERWSMWEMRLKPLYSSDLVGLQEPFRDKRAWCSFPPLRHFVNRIPRFLFALPPFQRLSENAGLQSSFPRALYPRSVMDWIFSLCCCICMFLFWYTGVRLDISLVSSPFCPSPGNTEEIKAWSKYVLKWHSTNFTPWRLVQCHNIFFFFFF